MTWVYVQRSGELIHEGVVYGVGYAGHGPGKNNPAMQDVRNVGPLPCGDYWITSLQDPHPDVGAYALRLCPKPGNEMFNRAGFWIHGDSKAHRGEASEGCPVFPRRVRERIWQSKDHDLLVVAEDPFGHQPETTT